MHDTIKVSGHNVTINAVPENPAPGDTFVDTSTRSTNVWDGSEWIEFSEADMVEMLIIKLMQKEGYGEDDISHMIDVLKHSHSH